MADELCTLLGPSEPAHPGLLRLAASLGPADAARALRAWTADDLYVQLWAGPAPARELLADRPLPLPAAALAVRRGVLRSAGRRPRGRFKTTCFLHGRADVRRRDVEAALARRTLAACPGWRAEAERPDMEIVAFAGPRWAVVALRLTDPSFRHREYGRHRASLSPTVAAALVRLARPSPGEAFLDPCCGAGTVLLERAAVSPPYAQLLGGDADPGAVAVARRNFGQRHRPWRLEVWDARRLPLSAASVDRVVTNLPFGAQVPAEGGAPELAAAVLREAARVLRPTGLAVVLAAGRPARLPPGLRPARALPIRLVGRPVEVLVFERAPCGGT